MATNGDSHRGDHDDSFDGNHNKIIFVLANLHFSKPNILLCFVKHTHTHRFTIKMSPMCLRTSILAVNCVWNATKWEYVSVDIDTNIEIKSKWNHQKVCPHTHTQTLYILPSKIKRSKASKCKVIGFSFFLNVYTHYPIVPVCKNVLVFRF